VKGVKKMRTKANIPPNSKEKTLIDSTKEIFQKRFFDLLEQKEWSISKLLIEIDQLEGAGKIKGLSDSQFRNCLSPSYKGFPNPEVMILIAHVFGVSLGYLLGDGENTHFERAYSYNGVDFYVERKETSMLMDTRIISRYVAHVMPHTPANIQPSIYAVSNGRFYNDEVSPNNEMGFNFSMYEFINNLSEKTSHLKGLSFDKESDIIELANAAVYLKEEVRQVRKTHRLIRGYLGALGTLSADNYIMLSYLMGSSQAQ